MQKDPARSIKPSQRKSAGYALKALAVAGMVAAFAALGFIATTIDQNVGGLGETGKAVFSIAFYMVMGASTLLGYRLYRRGRQHTTLLAEEVVRRDTRPPIVYLRSFTDELAIAREEEDLATIFGDVAP